MGYSPSGGALRCFFPKDHPEKQTVAFRGFEVQSIKTMGRRVCGLACVCIRRHLPLVYFLFFHTARPPNFLPVHHPFVVPTIHHSLLSTPHCVTSPWDLTIALQASEALAAVHWLPPLLRPSPSTPMQKLLQRW